MTIAETQRRIESRTPARPRRGWLTAVARNAVRHHLGKLAVGHLRLIDGGDVLVAGEPATALPSATVEVLDPAFYVDLALHGNLGAAESYVRGDWRCDDLTALFRVFALNDHIVLGFDKGLARLALPFYLGLGWLHRNTRRGSQFNITAHYDIGNDFFQLMLDETMMYSCGIFETPGSTLADASVAKLERICRKLRLRPDDRVIEIGAGWGGFAIHAARNYGCRVTTTTISTRQCDLARQRIDAAGVADRVTLVMKDYRDLEGQYDKLVAIEMIEAVGHQFYDAFFRCCSRLLKPDGLMLLQAITMADRYYEHARRDMDFIKRYIFPGSCIPSLGRIADAVARTTDLNLVHLEDIGFHYAKTLAAWRSNVDAQRARIRELGYSERFLRLWEFYLCYCAGGFLERIIGDAQLLLAKPRARPEPLLGELP